MARPDQPDLLDGHLDEWLADHRLPEVAPGVFRTYGLVSRVEECVRAHGMPRPAERDAVDRLLAAWYGFGSADLHDEPTRERGLLARVGRDCEAVYVVVRSPRGLWLGAGRISGPWGGDWRVPTVRDWRAYATREAAIRGVADEGLRFYGESDRRNVGRMRKLLRAVVDGGPVPEPAVREAA